MKEAKIRENHEWFTQWQPSEAIIIDTSHHSLADTVEQIREYITDHANKT